MRHLVPAFLTLLATILTASSAGAFRSGDWVLARWQRGNYYYPAVVQSHSDGIIRLHYDDGSTESVFEKDNLVRPYDWASGSRIQCQWSHDNQWYAGNITSLSGGTLVIRYDDGVSESRPTGKCRSY